MQQNQIVSKNEPITTIAAQTLAGMYSTIAEAAARPQNQSLLFTTKSAPTPLTWGQAKTMLLTPAQAGALDEMQDLLKQIAQLVGRINVIAVSYEFDMPRIYAPEITERLMLIDERVMISTRVARRLGVEPVTTQNKHAKALNMVPRSGAIHQPKIAAQRAA